jgi:O-antigen/teichoic acid export membrane protein
MTLTQRVFRGVVWSYAAHFFERMLKLLTTAMLARLLLPGDFGVIGFALMLLGFIEATRDFGIKDALIYTPEPVDEARETAFIMNIGVGVMQFLLAFLLAPFVTYVIDSPHAVSIIRWLSVSFLIDALGNIHDGMLQKELSFRRRAVPEFAAAFCKGVVSVILAVKGFGVWSLVAGHLIGALVRCGTRWWIYPWRPGLRFSASHARSLWRYGSHILLFNLLAVILEHADQLIVVALLGEAQLGYYYIALRIPQLVTENLSAVLTRVLFPAYTKLQQDRAALSRGFLESTRYTSFVTIPAACGLALTAPDFVPIIFGENWLPAVALTQILAFVGMLATLAWGAGDVFKALGRPDLLTKLLIFESLLTFPLIWGLTQYSGLAVMAAWGNLLSYVCMVVVRLWLASRMLGFGPATFFKVFWAPLQSAMLMSCALLLWRNALPSEPSLAALASSIVIGAVVYLAALSVLQRQAMLQILSLLQRTFRPSTKLSSSG